MGSSPEVADLLDAVDLRLRVIREAEMRFLDRLAPNFNIFEILRGDEYALSTSLATLLNPSGSHGQARLFLDGFLELLSLPKGFSTRAVENVRQERSTTAGRRIDIVLEFDGGVLGIENKPWAADGSSQLADYADHLRKDSNGKHWVLVYLSEREPSASSVEQTELIRLKSDDAFQQISFRTIVQWLESCAQLSKALPVRLFVEDLASYISQNVYGELDMTEKNEVLNEVCRSGQRLETAISLVNSWGYIKEQLIKSLNRQLRAVFEPDVHLSYADRIKADRSLNSGKVRSGFHISSERWPASVSLRFQFDRSGYTEFFVGIPGWDERRKSSRELEEQVSRALTAEFGAISKSNKYWAWYAWASDTDELGVGFTKWDVSHQPWIAIQDGSLANRVLALTKRVDTVLSALSARQKPGG